MAETPPARPTAQPTAQIEAVGRGTVWSLTLAGLTGLAAAFVLLEDLGYEPLGETTDRGGRAGIGLTNEVPLGTHVIVVDPGTGRVLDEYLGPSTDPAEATSWTTYLRSAVLDSIDD